MALDVWIREKPMLVPEDYKTRFAMPCEKMPGFGFEWYKGTGVKPDNHPLCLDIPFRGCAECESDDVLVIAAQWNVNYHNGDRYYDYEIECQSCHKFTKRSYAEND